MPKKLFYLLPVTLLLFVSCSQKLLKFSLKKIEISGKITYDRVPSTITKRGVVRLDYENIKRLPSKNIIVKAIDRDGKVISQTSTNKSGEYKLSVPENSVVKIRAYAKIYKENYWDVTVVDNTNSEAIYVIDGAFSSVNEHNIRNLHASSGWGGDGYTAPRVSAPFAILDSINSAMEKVLSVDRDAKFPQLTVYWSINNIATSGDADSGQIITSHYDGERGLWILGDENSDTDEYDDHIIIHEWGHYFEDQFSRTDNIGGSHSVGEALDIRVAFGEGWGNAWSGIVTENPIYFDTSGYKQSSGWYMNLEDGEKERAGWYNEGSVQRILYDLYDRENEAHDKTTLGFAPIYRVLVDAQKNTPAFTSIFSFIDALKRENPKESENIDKTVGYENISEIKDIYGTNRLNSANLKSITPIYRDLEVGKSLKYCTKDHYGRYNKLGNRSYIKVKIDRDGTYRFDAKSKGSNLDPDIVLYQTEYPHKDIGVSFYEGRTDDSLIINLKRGEYLLDVFDASFNSNCSTISLKEVKINHKAKGKNGAIMSKPIKKRRLPRRQYY